MANPDEALQQELAELKEEYDRLQKDKIRAESDLENLTGQLAELTAQAEQEFGTADPAALKTLLAEKRAENERLVEEYRAHLESIRKGLDAVGDPENGGEQG